MTKGNEKKKRILGMPYGTAFNKLRKLLMFKLAQEAGKDICCRCGEKIETAEEFSIEHIVPWLNSDNPQENFWNLENIAFSHLKCNLAAADKTHTPEQNEKIRQATLSRRKFSPEEIRYIRTSTKRPVDLAKEFGTSRGNISSILHHKAYTDIE